MHEIKIKEPIWENLNSIESPEGWIGLREESNGWTVTGVDKQRWRDLYIFKTEEEARKFVVEVYYAQVERLIKRWLVT